MAASGRKAVQVYGELARRKREAQPGFRWLRFLRPPTELLGSALRLVLHGHDDSLKCVDVSPDGSRIVSADSRRFIRLWDARNGAELASRAHGNHHIDKGIEALKYHPSGDSIVGAHNDGCLIFFDPGFEQGSMILTDGVTGKPVAWLPMLVGGSGQSLTQWKDRQGQIVYVPTVRRRIDWHPTERIWANRVSHELSLFKLEGD